MNEFDFQDTHPHNHPNPLHPYVRIVEQPAKCGVRFRYECEGRISGAIPGHNNTTVNPTFPTIKIFNYSGKAKVVVSCVTKNAPYRAHPHNLVGKKSCREGVCQLIFEDNVCAFNNLGILCAKRKDIKERLRVRESLKVDPFLTGFGHKSQAFKIIDLAVIRLCFQVFILNPQNGQLDIPLEPVVSDAIYDKKAMSELAISKLSHYSSPVTGGTEVILLCDRVIKDDIQIRFFEDRNEELFWEAFADFKANDIHKHFAISFRTPRYLDQTIVSAVAVNIQLVRPSDGGQSESLPFYFLPITAKRPKIRGKGEDMRSEYQLPRIPETDTLATDFIDFDINCIQFEENHFLDHLWESSSVEPDGSGQLLDISEGHVRYNNWSNIQCV